MLSLGTMLGGSTAYRRRTGRHTLALFLGVAVLLGGASRTAAQADDPSAAGPCAGDACLERRPSPVLLPEREELPWTCGVGRLAAWTGVVGAALTLGGSVPLGLAHGGPRTRVGWGVFVGATGVLIPAVALGAYAPRRVCKADGHAPARFVGWWAYAGAMPLSIVALTRALKDEPPGMLPSVLIGTLAAVSLLHHGFDAYMSWRQARGPALRVHLGPVSGLSLAF